jgi:DNA processing protein
MRGLWQPEYMKAVAVVGTRTPSPLAEEIAFQIGKKLAQQEITVVSGLAVGVDTLAHQGALSISNSKTIAVLGSGVLNVYPEQNQALAQQCERHGMIISEIAPSEPPNASRLVARNRIISGLSQAVIVVETSDDGGAMHAARFAQAQGRTVYTVGLSASGNQALLENGAHGLHPDLSNLDTVFDHPVED